MIPGLDVLFSGGQGGLAVNASSSASSGPVNFGDFNFSPKGSTLPPVAWIALSVAGLLALIYFTRRRA